jgi:general L-amino acid transport system substrate-binding protein
MKPFGPAPAICAILLSVLAGCTDPKPTVQSAVGKIKAHGYVTCGASQGVPGLSRPDEKGVWRGFDTDICRAFAAAVLGDATKIRFVPLNSAQTLPAVQTGEIDVLSRTTTASLTRDVAIRFVTVSQFDTEAMIVRHALGATEPKQLGGRTVCLQGGGSSVDSMLTAMEADTGVVLKRVYFDSTITARDAYFAGRCDAYVTDGLAAASLVATVARNPAEHRLIYLNRLLPQAIWVARGDDRWFDVVRWTVNVLVWAEANGVTQANVDEKLKTGPTEVRRVLGGDGGYGRALGLDPRWAYNVVKQVGNYSEVWDRNLGQASPIKADRRLNKLYKDGGLLYPLPWEL